jgi:hypothetical protein
MRQLLGVILLFIVGSVQAAIVSFGAGSAVQDVDYSVNFDSLVDGQELDGYQVGGLVLDILGVGRK